MNIATGAVSVVDQAPDARVGALSGIGTSLAMDADQIVYSFGDPSAENPLRSTIIVRAIESGDVLRTIETDKVVFDLAAADQYVAYSEGRVDPDTSAAYEMDLMVSEAGVPEQKRVAEHSFHLASDGALLVWESQPDGLDGGASPASAIVGTQLPGVSRMVLSSPETTTGEAAADSPTAADGAVAWDEARAGIDHLVLRTDPTTALDLAQAETHFRPHIGGGWLVWQVLGEVSPGHESQALLGIALSNVPA